MSTKPWWCLKSINCKRQKWIYKRMRIIILIQSQLPVFQFLDLSHFQIWASTFIRIIKNKKTTTKQNKKPNPASGEWREILTSRIQRGWSLLYLCLTCLSDSWNEDYVYLNKVKLTLIIYGLHIYKFVYSSKFICNPKINTSGTFVLIHRHVQWWKIQFTWHT